MKKHITVTIHPDTATLIADRIISSDDDMQAIWDELSRPAKEDILSAVREILEDSVEIETQERWRDQ